MFRWLTVPYAAGVTAVTVLFGAFLVFRLGGWPSTDDEAYVFFTSRRPLGELLDTVIAERGGAPLHYLLAHLALGAWESLTAIRLISVVSAVAAIPVVAALVSRLSDRRTALLAAMVVAASWTTIYHGLYARMYGLFLLTTALSFLLLLSALEKRGWWNWAVWGFVSLAAIATQPYGALVVGAQALYVLWLRLRDGENLRRPIAAFAALGLAAAPLGWTYTHLASRFGVGVGSSGSGSGFGSPLEILRYLRAVFGDFTAGWLVVTLPLAILALAGFVSLARSRPNTAFLTASVGVVPTAALLAVRSGSGPTIFLETRHLIFLLPFVAMLIAAGIFTVAERTLPRWQAEAVTVAAVAIVSAQIAWGWTQSPWLYAGEPPSRKQAREDAARWLAATTRASDVPFAWMPLYLDAWRAGAPLEKMFVHRGDPAIALTTLEEASKPLGRGLWVLDASNEPVASEARLHIPEVVPSSAFESRAFGPFLVVRSTDRVGSVARFLEDTVAVQRMGQRLDVTWSWTSLETALTALEIVRAARGEPSGTGADR